MSLQEELSAATRQYIINTRRREHDRLRSSIAATNTAAANQRTIYQQSLNEIASTPRRIEVPIVSTAPNYLAEGLLPGTRSMPLNGAPADPHTFAQTYGLDGGSLLADRYTSQQFRLDRSGIDRLQSDAINRYLNADPADVLSNAIVLSATGQPRVGVAIPAIREARNTSANVATSNPLPTRAYNSINTGAPRSIPKPDYNPWLPPIFTGAEIPTLTTEEKAIAQGLERGGNNLEALTSILSGVGATRSLASQAPGLVGRGRAALAAGGSSVAGVWAWLSQEQQRFVGIGNLILNIHTAGQSSVDAFKSLDTVITNVSKLIGFKTEDDPMAKFLDEKIKSVFGADNVEKIKANWQLLSAAYRTGANILSKVRSYKFAQNRAIEKIAENQNIVNNQLVGSGLIAPENYQYQPEDVKIDDKPSASAQIANAAQAVERVANDLSAVSSDLVTFQKEVETRNKKIEEIDKKASEEKQKAAAANAPSPGNADKINAIPREDL
jgi:hypothetical protein